MIRRLIPALVVCLLALPFAARQSEPDRPASMVRIYYETTEQIPSLAQRYDLMEFRDAREGYVLALASDGEIAAMLAEGLDVEVDARRSEVFWLDREDRGGGGIPGFPCYQTVEETIAFAENAVVAHPDLASLIDVGDSWDKVNALGGYDLNVLKLTNGTLPGPKPALVATCSIHAREYTPAALCQRFAAHLLDGYGSDPEATWILDNREVHLMLHANPDGRKHAEAGNSWRKNTNTDYCVLTPDTRGADLNRNFEFEWGCCNGSSASECSLTFRGAAPASEPETQAVQDYLRSVFPDARPDDQTTPAPDTTQGIYFDIHAFSELVLWPWGYGGNSPNVDALTTLGRKLAWFNDYTPQQAIELYATDGTTIDFGYGDLGVASYVYELGTSFFQDCATFENQILPDNLASLLYAAKAAEAPYLLPSGPDVTAVTFDAIVVPQGTPITLGAVADDARFNNSNGVEPVGTVAAISASVAGAAQTLTPNDGAYDESEESGFAIVDTTGLAPGRHTIVLSATDDAGQVGVPTVRFFWVADGSEGTVNGTVKDGDSGTALAATVTVREIGTTTATQPSTGGFEVLLPSGDWTLDAEAEGYLPGSAAVALAPATSTDVTLDLLPIPPLLVVDDDDNSPDVRNLTTDALDALGERYALWDTGNSDDEPGPEDLAGFETVIWLSGDEYGGAAGPGGDAEAALDGWLDDVGCLWMASQDYYYDRGLTSFIAGPLGASSVASDVSQATVTVEPGSAFDGLGPYTLSYPYSNYSDRIEPDATASVSFVGNAGNAAIEKDAGLYRTAFWGFGIESLPTPADREAALTHFLAWCESLQTADFDGDGAVNRDDCAPDDPLTTLAPSGVADFHVDGEALLWSADPQATRYDVLRADDVLFSTSQCVASGLTSPGALDPTQPTAISFYLIRSENACEATLGRRSDGSPRTVAACP